MTGWRKLTLEVMVKSDDPAGSRRIALTGVRSRQIAQVRVTGNELASDDDARAADLLYRARRAESRRASGAPR